MTNIIELRPDKKLLNLNFEKYQFCSDTLPINYEKELQTEILRLELSSTQDSWLEARLFAFHNHLFKNPYDSSCWYIDEAGGIWKFQTNGLLDLFYTSETIKKKLSTCIYNPSIAFAAKDIVAICSGGGTLEFLIDDNEHINHVLFENVEPAVILDARYVKETSKIIVAIYELDETKKFSRLILLFYNYDKNSENKSKPMNLIQKQTLKIKGAIEHAYIEQNGKFCYIVSQDQVQFEYDSLNPIETNDSIVSQLKIPKYCWSQDEDSITIYVKIPEKYANLTAKVETITTGITVSVGDTLLLTGKTPNRLEPKLTTWKCKGDSLEIELSKYESGLMWSELLEGDTGGEYLPNEALAAEIHSRLSHLCSDQQDVNSQGQPAIGFNSEQLEECDLSGAENILQRISFNAQKITHMAMLGSSNRILFAEKQSSGQAICLRHDHDGCIWMINETDNEDWNLKHVHTFPGFGYVEASKTNKKFCISPNDASFIAIVEHTRHAFIYEKPDKNAKVGKQKIVDFGSEVSSILGAASINKYLIILTKSALYQLQVYS